MVSGAYGGCLAGQRPTKAPLRSKTHPVATPPTIASFISSNTRLLADAPVSPSAVIAPKTERGIRPRRDCRISCIYVPNRLPRHLQAVNFRITDAEGAR